MQTNTAKQYLTRAAASSWRPERGTITYADASLPEGSNRVSVELAGANRLDSGGSWRGPVAPEDRLLTFTMQREEGEWRIADLPDARVVPETWFGQAYRRVSLYYLDPTAQIMVPEPVFLPRGDQLATALVDRLIQGPSRRLRGDVEQSFVPPDVDVELSVTVSDVGVADIRLTGGVPMPSERDAALMVSQLTWTLAQDSSLTGVRISINGEPVILSEGTPVFAMDRGRFYDPTGFQSTSELFALRDGRLVHGAPGELAQASGPLGQRSYGIGALGVDLRGEKVAGVTTGGDRILLADVRRPRHGGHHPRRGREPAAASRVGLREPDVDRRPARGPGRALGARRCPPASGAGARDQRPATSATCWSRATGPGSSPWSTGAPTTGSS